MEQNILNVILSVAITGIIVITIKVIEYTKFKTLSGSHKATGVIFIIIAIIEIVYIASNMKILSPAIEVVTSLSAFLLFFTFVYLNKLQNAISGMSISLGRRINVGSKIEFKGKHGIITQIGLTKTIVHLDNTQKEMLIPNKKFDEEITIIDHSKDEEKSYMKNSIDRDGFDRYHYKS